MDDEENVRLYQAIEINDDFKHIIGGRKKQNQGRNVVAAKS